MNAPFLKSGKWIFAQQYMPQKPRQTPCFAVRKDEEEKKEWQT